MSRYIERSDGIVRALKVNYAHAQDSMGTESIASIRNMLEHLISNEENGNSLVNLITKARENGRSAQDHISRELWQCLNEFYHYIKDERMSKALRREDPATLLDHLSRNCILYNGTADMTMVRGEGYYFINIGKFLERSLQVADIIDLDFKESGAFEKEDIRSVIEEQILNGNSPRSVIYSINRLQRYFERLRSERNTDAHNKLNFMIGELHSRVRYSTAETVLQLGHAQFLLRVREDLYNIANALNRYYFAYS